MTARTRLVYAAAPAPTALNKIMIPIHDLEFRPHPAHVFSLAHVGLSYSFFALRSRLTEFSRFLRLGVLDIPPIVHRAPHSPKSGPRLTFPTP